MTENPDQATTTSREPTQSAAWLGPVCGMVAAVLYTMTNIALRDCIALDAYLVSAVKASPTVVVLGPLVGWMLTRPESLTRPRARMKQFIAASFVAQFFGNAAFQKALECIGLAASVPITLGVLIVGGAILGAVLLGEPVGRQKIAAMILLITAVVVLSIPRTDGGSVELSQAGSLTTSGSLVTADVLVGSMWAAVSGLAYSFFGVTLRQNLQSGMKATTLMFISGLVGTVTLWVYCFFTLGTDGLNTVSSGQWNIMIIGGICNFSAFIALTTSLRLLPLVAVNLINASQVAMAAIAGVLLFNEEVTVQLVGGILLTLAGLIVLARRTRATIVITD